MWGRNGRKQSLCICVYTYIWSSIYIYIHIHICVHNVYIYILYTCIYSNICMCVSLCRRTCGPVEFARDCGPSFGLVDEPSAMMVKCAFCSKLLVPTCAVLHDGLCAVVGGNLCEEKCCQPFLLERSLK